MIFLRLTMNQDNNKTRSERAIHFQEKRKQHLLEIAEDYAELIAELIEIHGKARVCDLAREMGISHVSVLKTLNKLTRDGYVTKNVQNTIALTAKGKELALFSKKKHAILFEFLNKIGVPEQVAAADVEGIEHHISITTLEAIETHLQNF